jgi:hypothetical protein
MNKLTIELIPSSSWYDNVRSNVSNEDWDVIRKKCYNYANHVCEICGDNGLNQGYQHRVECHEIWEFNNEKQILTGFISLCPKCHMVKHIGLAKIKGNEDIAIKHLMKINNINKKQANQLIEEAITLWKNRSKIKWNVDISFIDKYLSPNYDIERIFKNLL